MGWLKAVKNFLYEYRIIVLGIVFIHVGVLFIYVLFYEQSEAKVSLVEQRMHNLTEIIYKTIEFPMREGDMERAKETMRMVSQIAGITNICLADQEGIIRFSSDEKLCYLEEHNPLVWEALMSGDKKEGVIIEKGARPRKIYAHVIPFLNQPRCYMCHDRQRKVLGVLVTGFDWDKAMAETLMARTKMLLFFALVFFPLVAVIFIGLYQRLHSEHHKLILAQEQLVEDERLAAIGQMAAAMSHDLRNPLSGIKMATQFLKKKLGMSPPEDISATIKNIEVEADYANNFIYNILNYSRPQNIVASQVDVNKLIEEVMELLAYNVQTQKIRVEKHLADDIPQVAVDYIQIKQALVNLVLNAVQVMPDGGKITIVSIQENDQVKICVSDTGPGIPQEILNNIFTPFFTTKSRGIGLGLAIVQQVVKRHGGEVKVESMLNKGTTFTIILPGERLAAETS